MFYLKRKELIKIIKQWRKAFFIHRYNYYVFIHISQIPSNLCDYMHEYIGLKAKKKNKRIQEKRTKKWSSQQKVIIFYDWEENVWLWVERDALYSTMKHTHLHIRTFIWEWKQQHFYEFFDSSHIQLVEEWEIIQCKHTTLYIYIYIYTHIEGITKGKRHYSWGEKDGKIFHYSWPLIYSFILTVSS